MYLNVIIYYFFNKFIFNTFLIIDEFQIDNEFISVMKKNFLL